MFKLVRKLLLWSFYSFERKFVGLGGVNLLPEARDRIEVALSVADLSLDFGCTIKRVGPTSPASDWHARILRISEKINEAVHRFHLPALNVVRHHLVLQAAQSHPFFG